MAKQETTSQRACIIEDGVEVPASALVRVERRSGYGSVPGLEDDELADPAELERQVHLAEWAPILALPCKGFDGGIRPVIDEFGKLDSGAFGTWDYERLRGPFDKARYRADRLQEQLQWALIMLGTVQERLSLQARVAVLARIHSGVDLDDIRDASEHVYARWYLRARGLRNEIRELRVAGWRRRPRYQDA